MINSEQGESGGSRFWGAGAKVQPWLSSLAALRYNPAEWFRASVFRNKGRLMRCVYGLPSVPLSSFAENLQFRKEPILDGVCMAPFCGGKHDDFGTLMTIVANLRPKIVLEFGTAYGNTVANICRECPTARIYTVNALPEQISGGFTTYALTREEIGSVYQRYGFSDRVVQIYCDTLELDLSAYLSEPVVDLAIIDACHDPKYVVNDFLKIAPYLRKGGMVLLHDTHPRMLGHLWGSYIGCMTLRRRGNDLRHIANTWWGVWRKSDECQ